MYRITSTQNTVYTDINISFGFIMELIFYLKLGYKTRCKKQFQDIVL